MPKKSKKTTKKSVKANVKQASMDSKQFGYASNKAMNGNATGIGTIWRGLDRNTQAKKAGVDIFSGAAVTNGSALKAQKRRAKKSTKQAKKK